MNGPLDQVEDSVYFPRIMNWDWDKLNEKRQRNAPPTPPDLNKIGDEFKKFKDIPGRFPGGAKLIVPVLILLWLLSGIYIVQPDEMGVVKRFGAFNRLTGPGPHYHIPFPVESVLTPTVSQVQRFEVGFRTIGGREGSSVSQFRPVPEESLMLTGDENIVDVQFIVQYQIKNPQDYLFRIAQQDETVKNAAEAAMREVIGNNKIDSVLTTGKLEIQNQTKKLLQSILDKYESGISVVAVQLQDVHPPREVVDAFKDVASAREDKIRYINEADAYLNDLIPKTRGQAEAMLNQARAYKEQKVRQSQGESARFLALLTEYEKAPEVTRKRLYLEAMEEILSNKGVEKTIISQDAASKTTPLLPLSTFSQTPTAGVQPQKGGQ